MVPNRLADATSPYLRQHADNPVDWWPWCDEAFAEAERRDVPVFLSVGYAACHWCHVMAHESFEDPTRADQLNAEFPAGFLGAMGDEVWQVSRDRQLEAAQAHASQALPTSVLWRRLELMGNEEHVRWLRRPVQPAGSDASDN